MPPSKPPPPPENEIQANIARGIGKHGWAAQAVMPTEDQPQDPFAYSIGFWRTFDHAELIVTGMRGDIAHALLDLFVEEHLRKGVIFEADRRYPDLLPGSAQGGAYPGEFREVSKKNRETMMSGAWRWNAYEDFPALQIVWPDPNGLFPWEKSYDRRFIQPILS